ncbi:MerR family transcriptional regulator [Aeromicrobium sp. CFBP 8757]|uniref:MerR family transcriptional regulator n=1 Tax=Aeromicrobium sp. CFBP 8757 TaxID=2775288 RepID=UPI0017859E22|nr:MerR family transcriptional regulator [Aeromicrobium sp. CFBP 8757]MBD8606953.1 MerR family transcriptional regulator [Aeromicrobium sp. CFBP 8757]
MAMHIGEVAARTDLSLRSLRHWEDVGLVVPSGRSEGGFRLYAEEDVERILFVRRMKPLGFTLDEMKAVMADLAALRDPGAGTDDRARAGEHLADVQRDAAERRARLERQLAMADEFLGLLATELDAP